MADSSDTSELAEPTGSVGPAEPGEVSRSRWAEPSTTVGLAVLVGLVCGASSALFLELLELATKTRLAHEWLVYLLPVAGLVVGLVYERFGKPVQEGVNLVLDRVHDGGAEIPARMAPMVLVGTVLTHLFGGSAGREGTAVQMGASLADFVAHRFRVSPQVRKKLVIAGIAGGFGAVFGTPIAGAVFGLEVLMVGRLEVDALLPAMVAALVGDLTTRSLGVSHTPYPQVPELSFGPLVMGKWLVFAACIALVTTVFVELLHALKSQGKKRLPRLPVRMFVGGVVIVVAWKAIGTSNFLGLGVPLLVRAFDDPNLPVYVFAAKLVFTAVTLGAGFLGGEVTPLFVVGATLGSVLARVLGLPVGLGAAVGMAGVFAAASNAPLALAIMATELCGAHVFVHAALVCVVATLLTGHRGIYPAQRVFAKKGGGLLRVPRALRDFRDKGDG